MAYFSSEYECKIDDKGRLVLPTRYKSALPEGFDNQIVLTRGFEPCLTIYPLDEWQKIFEKVSALNEFNPEYRRFQRNFLRGNTEIELDKSGRFLIPKTMMRHAKLERDAILVGMGSRIEIWNPEVYEEYLIKDQGEFSNLAKQFLGEGGEWQGPVAPKFDAPAPVTGHTVYVAPQQHPPQPPYWGPQPYWGPPQGFAQGGYGIQPIYPQAAPPPPQGGSAGNEALIAPDAPNEVV